MLAVEGYPATKRPFYAYPQPDAPGWTNSSSQLLRCVGLVTGAQRLHRDADYARGLADYEGNVGDTSSLCCCLWP